jgi:hypothetical protein
MLSVAELGPLRLGLRMNVMCCHHERHCVAARSQPNQGLRFRMMEQQRLNFQVRTVAAREPWTRSPGLFPFLLTLVMPKHEQPNHRCQVGVLPFGIGACHKL